MMTARHRLPHRHQSETFDLEFAGLKYNVTISRFPGGGLAECFVSNHKAGNAADVAARDAGILLSLCLQHGCDVATISLAISRKSGSAAGVIGAVLDRFEQEQTSREGSR
jgi:hypothetical protein